MGPFRSAMNLIYAYHANFATEFAQVFDEKSLRGYKEHFDFLLLNCHDDLFLALVG